MKKIIFLVITIISMTYLTYTQNPQWVVYNTSNSGLPTDWVTSVAIEPNGTKWIGTYSGGLAEFDGSNWVIYNDTNSPLPENHVRSIAIEENGTKWIGTHEGLASFDGNNWTVYDTSNSELPHHWVDVIAIDGQGKKWIGTRKGLAVFDDNIWTVYDTSNSELPGNHIKTIAIENNYTVWIGAYEEWIIGIGGTGLTSFDGNSWIVYDTSNSDLPGNLVCALAIEQDGTKWIGTHGWKFAGPSGWVPDGRGLASFDGNNWVVYDTINSGLSGNEMSAIAIEQDGTKWTGTKDFYNMSGYVGSGLTSFDGSSWIVYNNSNSGLPNNNVNSITIDTNGTKWIGTHGGGLAVYNENGIPVGIEESSITNSQLSIRLYPNPASYTFSLVSHPGTEIISLEIIDIQGKVVMYQIAPNNEQSYNISHFPKGMYFIKIYNKNSIETKKLVIQ